MTKLNEIMNEIRVTTDERDVIDKAYDEARARNSKLYDEFHALVSNLIDVEAPFRGLVFEVIGNDDNKFQFIANKPAEGTHQRKVIDSIFEAFEMFDSKDSPDEVRSISITLKESYSDSTGVRLHGTGLFDFSNLRIWDTHDGIQFIIDVFHDWGTNRISVERLLTLKRYCERYGFKFHPRAFLDAHVIPMRWIRYFKWKMPKDEKEKVRDWEVQKNVDRANNLLIAMGYFALMGLFIDSEDGWESLISSISDTIDGKDKKSDEEV